MAERPWFGERNAADDETTRVRIQGGPPPLGTPAPPDALPAFIAGWPAPPGPQRLDRDRELPGFPPAVPDVGIDRPAPATGDERWTMSTPVPRSVGTAWETRPAPETFATPAGGPQTEETGGAPAIPSMTEILTQKAMNAVTPKTALQRLLRRDVEAAAQSEMLSNKAQFLTERAKDRTPMELSALQAMQDFEKGYQQARPAPPELKKSPEAPDVKIRPWLDPEGKNGLVVMVQALSAMALAAGGMALKTPQTMLGHLRQAAEDWRRDEVDAAASNFKQFQIAAEKHRDDNATALRVYEIADKEWGQNLIAKQAAVTTRLQAIGLYDQATIAATMPFDAALATTEKMLAHSNTMFEGMMTYLKVTGELEAAKDKLPTNELVAAGEIERLKYDMPKMTEAEAVAAQRRITILTGQIKNVRDAREAFASAQAGITMAGKAIPDLEKGIESLNNMMGLTTRLMQSADRLAQKGMLPTDPSTVSQWLMNVQRRFPKAWADPQVQADISFINQFYKSAVVTFERTVVEEIGPRFKGAYGLPDDPSMLTIAQYRKNLTEMFQQAKEAAIIKKAKWDAYLQMIPTVAQTVYGQKPGGGEPE